MKPFTVFLGGAAIGAIAALLLAPESGDDLRARLRGLLQKKISGDVAENENELAMIMEKISADLEDKE